MNINEHIEAESDTKRSIAMISFELKYLSRCSLSTIFCMFPIPYYRINQLLIERNKGHAGKLITS